MQLKTYVFFGVIIIGIIFFFQWRISIMSERILKSQSGLNDNMNNNFRLLSDSVSAKSQVTVVAQPGMFDKLFNTALEKQYEAIRKQIPKVIADEIEKIKIENKHTTVNQTVIQMEGDSVIFKNSEGVVISTAKVVPLNSDSSMLLILPQEIELTNVSIQPDPNNLDSIYVFLSARNKTTGKELRISQATTYVMPGDKKKWTFNTMPFVGSHYDLLNREFVFKGGFHPIQYNGKNIKAQLLGVEFSYGLKNQAGIELEILNLQLLPKKK